MRIWKLTSNKNTCRTVEIKDPVSLQRPTLICLMGGLTTEDESVDALKESSKKQLREMQEIQGTSWDVTSSLGHGRAQTLSCLGYIVDLLGGKQVANPAHQTNPDIYGVSYASLDANLANNAAYAADPLVFYSDEAAAVVQKFFLPHIATNGTMQREANYWVCEGERKDLNEVISSFRNVTLYGFSRGGTIAHEVENAVRDCMQQLGYSEAEIKQAMSEVCLIVTGNAAPVISDQNDYCFRSIIFEGTNDKVAQQYNKFKRPIPAGHDKVSVIPLKHNGALMLVDLETDFVTWMRDAENPGLHVPVAYEEPSAHYLTTYTKDHIAKPESLFPNMLANVLRHSLTRQHHPLDEATDFLRPAAPLAQADNMQIPPATASYMKWVEKALARRAPKAQLG